MLLHEASIIATKEKAEMKMIDFFIARKIVVDGAGHSIAKAPCAGKRAVIFDEIGAGSSIQRRHGSTKSAGCSCVSITLPASS